jgi:hypothetical protein
MKSCSHCKVAKPLYAFTRDRTSKDGLFSWCSQCKSENRKAAYIAAHPERVNRELAKQVGREHLYKLKLCIDCLQEKPIGEFHRKRDAKEGVTAYCRKCGNARSAKWQADNAARLAPKRLKWRQKSPRPTLSVSLRGALRRRETENPATLDDLMKIWEAQNGLCALSGIKMTWAQGKLLSTSITMDRIDHMKGYSADNIRLLCHAVNAFLGRMSDQDMYKMAAALVENMKPKCEPNWMPHLVHSEAA